MLTAANPHVQPALILSGVFLDHQNVRPITNEFLLLKRKYFRRWCERQRHDLEHIRVEIKGSELRKEVRESKKLRKHHFGFIDNVLELIRQYSAVFVAHIWIKELNQKMDGTAVYTTSVQFVCRHFQHYLETHDDTGILVADYRTPELNSDVSHSVFTQKYKASGDALPRILEMPLFAHSDNHALIQISDLICSALLYPIATQTYCSATLPNSKHVHAEDAKTKERYAPKLRTLQYRYYKEGGWKGGISVDDKLNGWPSRLMVN